MIHDFLTFVLTGFNNTGSLISLLSIVSVEELLVLSLLCARLLIFSTQELLVVCSAVKYSVLMFISLKSCLCHKLLMSNVINFELRNNYSVLNFLDKNILVQTYTR